MVTKRTKLASTLVPADLKTIQSLRTIITRQLRVKKPDVKAVRTEYFTREIREANQRIQAFALSFKEYAKKAKKPLEKYALLVLAGSIDLNGNVWHALEGHKIEISVSAPRYGSPFEQSLALAAIRSTPFSAKFDALCASVDSINTNAPLVHDIEREEVQRRLFLTELDDLELAHIAGQDIKFELKRIAAAVQSK